MAKIESGNAEWHTSELDLREVIEESVAATYATFNDRHVTLTQDLASHTPRIRADRDRLIQVMLNLLSNAVKFCHPTRGQVHVSLRQEPGGLRVDVRDNGSGISAANQKIIFERFRQVGDTMTNKPQGTGLGLPISRHIIERFGGRLWVQSEPGNGATFSFTLPFSQGTGACSASIARLDQHMSKRILIADDEPNIVVSLEFLMKREGFDVQVAVDGEAALQAIAAQVPDLILLDIMLPRKDGFEVCQQIRANPQWQSIKVVMLTAKGRDTEVSKGLALGADAYMTKPFSTKDLVAQVRQLLGLPVQ
ncbi:hybrid sensor histidine kinase/response regulator [Polaromonas sp. P1(28)-8]|nr:hybrid sensor histidine kinase/response regulator [Polaromonas sp. P1(28)-8]